MRQITGLIWITKTKAKLYLDEELFCTVTRRDVQTFNLREDEMLDDTVLQNLYQETLVKRAKQKALDLLTGKDYTEYELYTKLEREFQSTALAQSAVDYVKGYHYIDDERYARNFVTYQGQNLSRQQLLQKLRIKGIDDCFIESAFEQYATDDDALLRHLIAKKYSDYPNYEESKKKKVIQSLLRKGFRYSDIMNCLKEA